MGGPDISVRAFDATVIEAYRQLFPNDPGKTEALLRWRFEGNPHGPAKFVVAEQGGRIAGMIALVPSRLGNGPTALRGYQAIDTAVHPDWRGRGIFVELGTAAQSQEALNADVLWGFPNANAAPGWFGRLGWTSFGAAPLMMRPLRSSYLIGKIDPALRGMDIRLIGKREVDSRVYSADAEIGARLDRLWAKIRAGFGVAVNRDGHWMRWRLLDKPDADYRCVGIENIDGEIDAFVATKIAEKHGGRLCYVMEAFCAEGRENELAGLLAAELFRASSQGAELALACCPRSAPNRVAYQKAGFLPVPARLRPIEINFGARALGKAAADAAQPEAKWYVSFLDSDTN